VENRGGGREREKENEGGKKTWCGRRKEGGERNIMPYKRIERYSIVPASRG